VEWEGPLANFSLVAPCHPPHFRPSAPVRRESVPVRIIYYGPGQSENSDRSIKKAVPGQHAAYRVYGNVESRCDTIENSSPSWRFSTMNSLHTVLEVLHFGKKLPVEIRIKITQVIAYRILGKSF
jgi:hypothetical protein